VKLIDQSAFAIVSPQGRLRAAQPNEYEAWAQFLNWPKIHPQGTTLDEAIMAWKAIGYTCRKVAVVEMSEE